MSLLIVLAALLLLIVLVGWVKLNPFLALLLTAILAGLALGLPAGKLPAIIQKGVGDTLGGIVLIIAFGAMLGKLVAESGAAQKIASVLMATFGARHLQWALMITAFIVGIPLFYGVGFVLLVPLLFSLTYQYRLPAVYTGLPMLAALSVTHGFLPPHPAPVALAQQFGASLGKTLWYGILVAIPTVLIAGPLYARTLKLLHAAPLDTFRPDEQPPAALPGTFNAFSSAPLPVLLLGATTLLSLHPPGSTQLAAAAAFLSDGGTVLLLSLLVALWSLGWAQGRSTSELMHHCGEALKDISLILLIIGSAGALKQVLTESGVSQTIAAALQHQRMPPLVLGWLIAALIRIAVGSATVAGLTAAGIIAPVVAQSGTDPNLMVLAVGAGSLACSHVNDSGFWLFKEYFNLDMKNTFRSWTVMETLVAIVGLAGVLVLERLL